MATDEEKIKAFYAKFHREPYFSKQVVQLRVGEYDPEESLGSDVVFHMSHMGVTDEDASSLALAILEVQPQNMRSLYLGNNEIGDVGFAALVNALWTMPGIDTLWFANNAIGDTGMEAFGELYGQGLGAGECVKHISLQNNQIGDDGLKSLAVALGDGLFPNLEWLYLAENRIGDAGVVAFAGMLQSGGCPKLKRLSFKGNLVGDEGVLALATALRKGKMGDAEFVYVNGNPFSQEAARALSMAVKGSDAQVHLGWPAPKTASFLAEGPTHPQEIEKWKKLKPYEKYNPKTGKDH